MANNMSNEIDKPEKMTYSIGFTVAGPIEAFFGAVDIIGEAEKAEKPEEPKEEDEK